MTADDVIEVHEMNSPYVENNSICDATVLVTAYDLFNIFKCFLLMIVSLALMLETTANLYSKKFLGIKLLK